MSGVVDRVVLSCVSGETVKSGDVLEICEKVNEYYSLSKKSFKSSSGNVIRISITSSLVICGDIHGQYLSLLEIFLICGTVNEREFLFLGDYVDRGYYSLICILLLFCLKLKYPNRVFLLRGNHESRQICQTYGFYDECLRVYGVNIGAKVWKTITSSFYFLPLCAVINNKFLALHAGLSPKIDTLLAIEKIKRHREIPLTGAFCDLMWSDPLTGGKNGWKLSPRGAGFLFGKDISKRFLYKNNLSKIFRAHQLAVNGFTWSHENNVCTVFSAPNYCYSCNNKGAVAVVNTEKSDLLISFQQFDQYENLEIKKINNSNTSSYFGSLKLKLKNFLKDSKIENIFKI